MTRRLLFLSLLVALALPSAAPGSALLVLKGRGYGHGVGLSQCGAYGFASKAGWTYDRIVAHYYPGTTLGPAPTETVRVLLKDSRAPIEVESDTPFTAADANGQILELAAGSATIGPDLKLTADG